MGKSTIVVIGGGIAGLSCIEALIQDFESSDPQYDHIILISESRIIKKVVDYVTTGRSLETFDVKESDIDDLDLNITEGLKFEHIVGIVNYIDSKKKIVIYNDGLELSYDKLCICTGSKPRLLSCQDEGHNVELESRTILIRDTSSVHDLRSKLSRCRRLVIVGNGGISLEVVSKIADCDKVWIIRDNSIGYAFFDSGCAKFMMETMQDGDKIESNVTREQYCSSSKMHGDSSEDPLFGPALGPHWTQRIELKGGNMSQQNLDIEYQDEVCDIVYSSSGNFPLRVTTRKNKLFECDLIVVAIGVDPNRLKFADDHPEISSVDGGLLIDNQMRTSLASIYAAGDVCSCDNWPRNGLWFQKRLWTQARQMGYYSGRCIAAHIHGIDPTIYFNFDCFTHCTTFFGHKLVLLGKYNGQQVDDDERFEVIARVNPGKDYVKILVNSDGRIIGAVLAGESGLEETIENLIHDKIDISRFKEHLLDDTVDIEDYFD